MTGVCVGPGFKVNPDASLGLNGPRAGVWPYTSSGPCSIASANGVRLDAAKGLWAEPPDLRVPAAASGTNATPSGVTTSWQSMAVAAQTFTNPDPCRPAQLFGALEVTFTLQIPAGVTVTVNGGVYNTTPPAPASIPAVWSMSNPSAATISVTETVTLPYSFAVAAGATATIAGSFWYEGSSASGTFTSAAWNYAATGMTARTSW